MLGAEVIKIDTFFTLSTAYMCGRYLYREGRHMSSALDGKSVESAVESIRIAMVRADSLSLEQLTHQALSYGHTSGLVENRAEFIGAIVGEKKRDVFNSITLSNQTITIADDTATAIVRHRFVAEVVVNGVIMKPDIMVMQVWQQEDGLWKLIARQAYKV
jgi:hypothetical protein